jgi:hypothetical protein
VFVQQQVDLGVITDPADGTDRADVDAGDADVTLDERDPLHVVEQDVHDLLLAERVGLGDSQPGGCDRGDQDPEPDQATASQHPRRSFGAWPGAG